MKIAKNPVLLQKINDLIALNNININVADMLNLAFSYTDIISVDSPVDEQIKIIEQLYDFYQLDKNNSFMIS